jgi:hypothetical protein
MAKNRIIFTDDFVLKDGKVGINTTEAQALLDVGGELKVSGVSTFHNNVNISGTVGIGTAINIVAYDNLYNGTLSFEGSSGQLFSITNNLTSGSIFSVNNVYNIPIIDVDADGTIQLAPYGSTEYVGIGTTNPTSKLDVSGNLRVSGVSTFSDLYVNGALYTDTDVVLTDDGRLGIGTTNPISLLNVGVDLVGESKNVIFGKRLSGITSTAFPVQVIGDLLIDGNGYNQSKPMGNLVFHIENFADNGILWRTTQYGYSGYSAGILAVGDGPWAPAGLAFYTSTSSGSYTQSASERLRIAGNGDVGIGTDNPTAKLDVGGDVRVGIDTSQGLILTSPNGTTFRLVVDDSGNLSAISTTL